MKTALVIGALGFMGRHLTRRVAELGDARVVGADLAEQPMHGPDIHEYRRVDITDVRQVEALVESVKPDWVFNMCAATSGTPQAFYSVNVLGAVNLLEAIKVHAPQARVVLVGSASEYGAVDPAVQPVTEDVPCRPEGVYAISKYAATLAALDLTKRHSLKVVIARPFNPIGPGMQPWLVTGAVLQRAKAALAGSVELTVKVGNLEAQRDFVDVEDVVEAFLGMVRGEFWGEVFNVCTGRPVAVREAMTMLLSHSPRPIRMEVDPALYKPVDVAVLYGSYEKARKAFGFEPRVSLDESLRRTWDYEMGRAD